MLREHGQFTSKYFWPRQDGKRLDEVLGSIVLAIVARGHETGQELDHPIKL